MIPIVVKDKESYLRLEPDELKALLKCPCSSCEFILWGTYRRKLDSDEGSTLFVQRVRCKVCKKTHAVLPSFVLGRVRHTAETVQAFFEKWIESGTSIGRLWSELERPQNISTLYRWRCRFRWTLCGFDPVFTNPVFIHQPGI